MKGRSEALLCFGWVSTREGDAAWFDFVSKTTWCIRTIKISASHWLIAPPASTDGPGVGILGFLRFRRHSEGGLFILARCHVWGERKKKKKKACFCECVWTLLTLLCDSKQQRGVGCSSRPASARSRCSLKFLFLLLWSVQFLINLPGRMWDSTQACKWLSDWLMQERNN